ncbi:TIGR01620 family protein [Pararhodobacter sp. SW119]|uniref:YcjF family protein n=1 Tax=Pararhodobacter sp. SW119 TaxID=2780075 RepID=UPI001AE0473F|nr:TIGR01620 family protein [Pararhodobacter sp. SW119]
MTDPGRPKQGPVLIEIDGEPSPDPGAAPPIEDELPLEGRAMQATIGALSRPARPWARLFWGAAGAFLILVLGVAAWDFATGLIARQPWLGALGAGLLGVLVVGLLVLAVREALGIYRLRRLDGLRLDADRALAGGDLAGARAVADRLARLYAGPLAQDWAAADELLDADAVIDAAEARWLVPIDARARAEVELAARQVAMVTALVPVALADVAAALLANLRMIRRIAELYGGRAGALGSLRLARAVVVHLMATGVVAVGDDMIGSFAGGGLAAKLSRRFGEGVVNGALTARVGVSAIEVCRPLPFRAGRRPSVSALVGRALQGAFRRG